MLSDIIKYSHLSDWSIEGFAPVAVSHHLFAVTDFTAQSFISFSATCLPVTLTVLSRVRECRCGICLFSGLHHRHESRVIAYEKETNSFSHRRRLTRRSDVSQCSCLFAIRVCREDRETLLPWQYERRHPGPAPQNPRRTRLLARSHNSRKKRGDLAFCQEHFPFEGCPQLGMFKIKIEDKKRGLGEWYFPTTRSLC